MSLPLRLRLRATLAALTGLLVVPLSGAGAGAATEPDSWVPAGTMTVTGRGFGHGHGMSQYGAQGAATQGLNYRQILGFYYPGTTVAKTTAAIRVLLTADSDNNTLVLPRSGLGVRDVASNTSWTLPTGPTQWRLSTINGVVKVCFLRPNAAGTPTWYPWRTLGSRGGEFFASGPITLRSRAGDRSYRGRLRYVPTATGGTRTVNLLSMDGYLKGVVPAEMPASWKQAALRAQVVAARTYALFERASRKTSYFDVYDSTRSQVYGGFGAEQPGSSRAVDLTPQEYRSYGGAPAFTQFSASDGGYTADGGKPYLPARLDTYDGYPTWTKSVSTAPLVKAHPEVGTLVRLMVTQRDGNGEYGGRVVGVTLQGRKADGTSTNVVLGGSEVRSLLGLRSTLFRLG